MYSNSKAGQTSTSPSLIVRKERHSMASASLPRGEHWRHTVFRQFYHVFCTGRNPESKCTIRITMQADPIPAVLEDPATIFLAPYVPNPADQCAADQIDEHVEAVQPSAAPVQDGCEIVRVSSGSMEAASQSHAINTQSQLVREHQPGGLAANPLSPDLLWTGSCTPPPSPLIAGKELGKGRIEDDRREDVGKQQQQQSDESIAEALYSDAGLASWVDLCMCTLDTQHSLPVPSRGCSLESQIAAGSVSIANNVMYLEEGQLTSDVSDSDAQVITCHEAQSASPDVPPVAVHLAKQCISWRINMLADCSSSNYASNAGPMSVLHVGNTLPQHVEPEEQGKSDTTPDVRDCKGTAVFSRDVAQVPTQQQPVMMCLGSLAPDTSDPAHKMGSPCSLILKQAQLLAPAAAQWDAVASGYRTFDWLSQIRSQDLDGSQARLVQGCGEQAARLDAKHASKDRSQMDRSFWPGFTSLELADWNSPLLHALTFKSTIIERARLAHAIHPSKTVQSNIHTAPASGPNRNSAILPHKGETKTDLQLRKCRSHAAEGAMALARPQPQPNAMPVAIHINALKRELAMLLSQQLLAMPTARLVVDRVLPVSTPIAANMSSAPSGTWQAHRVLSQHEKPVVAPGRRRSQAPSSTALKLGSFAVSPLFADDDCLCMDRTGTPKLSGLIAAPSAPRRTKSQGGQPTQCLDDILIQLVSQNRIPTSLQVAAGILSAYSPIAMLVVRLEHTGACTLDILLPLLGTFLSCLLN